MVYKVCAVPECKSTTIRTPNKLFVTVPKDAKKGKKWLQLARRNVNDIQPKTAIYFCEDHFNRGDSEGVVTRDMSPRSSSGSWSGAARAGGGGGGGGGAGVAGGGAGGGGGAPDIIDLDRYMRGAVRPGARRKDDKCERLVVDAGGIGRKLAAALSEQSSTSEESAPRERDKRYSHDSGLSDGSYVRRRQREHRRNAGAAVRGTRDREAESSNSMRTFRAACERALREQQEQIARVAQICERLTVYRAPPAPPAPPPAPPSADSTELSSSSRSTRDQRRRDKRRSAECKTYKIIMSKLDELNRLFAARSRSPPAPAAAAPRRRSPPAPAPAPAPPPPPAPATSASVSVSDKFVATEPVLKPATTDMRASYRQPRHQVERGGCSGATRTGKGTGAGGESERRRARLAALRTLDLDIAPQQHYSYKSAGAKAPAHPADPAPATTPALTPSPAPTAPASRHLPRLNVATESVVLCSTASVERSGGGSTCGDGCKFDLDDPVHLYAQAKRLQTLRTRARLAGTASTHSFRRAYVHTRPHTHAHTHTHAQAHAHAHAPGRGSLCALCRGYWRALTSCLVSRLFSKEQTC